MSTSRKILFLNTVNTFTHFCIGSITVICCIYGMHSTSTSSSFSQHIILCVIGYVLLMSQAIMTFSNSNGWAQALSYDQKKTFHLVMQVAGSALAISGSIIRIQGYGGDAFGTTHGVFGLLALIFTVLSLIGGVANMYMKVRGNVIKICHALAGCATLTLAFIALIIGMDKDMFRVYVAHSGANTLIALAVMAMIGVLFPACFGVYRRIVQ